MIDKCRPSLRRSVSQRLFLQEGYASDHEVNLILKSDDSAEKTYSYTDGSSETQNLLIKV